MIVKLAKSRNGTLEYPVKGCATYSTSEYSAAKEFNLDDPKERKLVSYFMSNGYYICETRGDFPLRPMKDYEAILLSAI